MSSLEDLRRRINELDRQILELVGKRQETSREVARAKRATGQATRDYNREREVLLAAREAGKQFGVSPLLAENILRLLSRSSPAPERWGAGSPSSWRRRGLPWKSRIRPAHRRDSPTSPTGVHRR